MGLEAQENNFDFQLKQALSFCTDSDKVYLLQIKFKHLTSLDKKQNLLQLIKYCFDAYNIKVILVDQDDVSIESIVVKGDTK